MGESAPEFFAALQFSHIADTIGFIVLALVAVVAKGQTVIDGESQFWVRREWFDVVRPEIAAAGVTATLASEFIAAKHCVAPILVLWSATVAEYALGAAVAVVVVELAARCSSPGDFADFLPSLRGVRNAFSVTGFPQFGSGHFLFGRIGVFLSLKCGHPAAQRRVGVVNPATLTAHRRQTVAARPVFPEIRSRSPSLARAAPLFAAVQSGEILIQADSDSPGGYFHRP